MADNDVPQFATAEFEPVLNDSHPLFIRGLLFGGIGALLGLALYATVVIVTGYEIGFVSLAVGWIVGTMVVKGSKGRTGRRYQIAAVLLTYFAVSMSAIPVGLHYFMTHRDAALTEASRDGSTSSPGGTSIQVSADDPAGAPREMSAAAAIGMLLVLGFISPFAGLSGGMSGLIGLVILSVGIRIAWRITADRATTVQTAIDQPPPGWPPGSADKPTTLDLNR